MYYPSPQEVATQRAFAKAESQRKKNQQLPATSHEGTTQFAQDPFKIFDKIMQDEFGRDYRANKAWKGGEGVTNLTAINRFVKKTENAQKEFKKLDVDKSNALSKDELAKYIYTHSDLWQSLSRMLDIGEKTCISVATNVAFALALKKEDAMNTIQDRELTAKEFKRFHKHYITSEKGANEFYLRIIFAIFDLNHDGVLSTEELDRFLDVFYKSRTFFQGNESLPDRQSLNEIVCKRCDVNNDGALEFSEVRDLLVLAAVVTVDN